MANTDPVNDNHAITRFILEKSIGAKAKIYPIAATTRNLAGEELTEMGDLCRAGAVAFSDDGRCLKSTEVVRRALEYSRMFGRVIIEHCQDMDLTGEGVMHEGLVSTRLGMAGIPSIAEELIVQRDIQIAEYTMGRIHIAHISTEKSVDMVRQAKKRNIQVTAEVTPHHLFLTDEACAFFNTNTKMNPPLRTEKDRQALVQGLIDGTIDCIATDHAPHTVQDKDVEYMAAPNGIIGLETSLALVLTRLVHTRKISASRMVEVMSSNPCRILGIQGGTLTPGHEADITVIDPEKYWIVNPDLFFSKSRNTPFTGWNLRGAAHLTLVSGQIVFESSD
jgi:dihydroorotase